MPNKIKEIRQICIGKFFAILLVANVLFLVWVLMVYIIPEEEIIQSRVNARISEQKFDCEHFIHEVLTKK